MLSRQAALVALNTIIVELEDENARQSSLTDALQRVFILHNDNDNLPEPATENDLVTRLRQRLLTIAGYEQSQPWLYHAVIYERVFKLLLILSKTFPINDRINGFYQDRVTGTPINPNASTVFASTGELSLRSSAAELYLSDAINHPESREIKSLKRQGVSFYRIKSLLEIAGKFIGTYLGLAIGFGLMSALFIVGATPLAAITSLVSGLITGLINSRFPSMTLLRPWPVILGFAATMVLSAALIAICPPIMGLLVSHALVSTGAAAVALPIMIHVIPIAVLFIQSVVGLARQRWQNIPFADTLYATLKLPPTILMNVLARSLALLGRILNATINGITATINYLAKWRSPATLNRANSDIRPTQSTSTIYRNIFFNWTADLRLENILDPTNHHRFTPDNIANGNLAPVRADSRATAPQQTALAQTLFPGTAYHLDDAEPANNRPRI